MDLEETELRQAIRSMSRRSALYRILKTELMARGYWRNLPRGNPRKGYETRQKRALAEPNMH